MYYIPTKYTIKETIRLVVINCICISGSEIGGKNHEVNSILKNQQGRGSAELQRP